MGFGFGWSFQFPKVPLPSLLQKDICACFILFFPGAKEDDYVVDDELNKVIVEESSRDTSSTKPEDPLSDADTSVKTSIGSISFVSCATGEDAMKTLSSSGAGDPLSSEEGQYHKHQDLLLEGHVFRIYWKLIWFPFFLVKNISIQLDSQSMKHGDNVLHFD